MGWTECERAACKEDLRRRLGLTKAEAEVALEIVKGDGREVVAARLGVSLSTVRTHPGHIFEKTGARRQAELVATVAGLSGPGTASE